MDSPVLMQERSIAPETAAEIGDHLSTIDAILRNEQVRLQGIADGNDEPIAVFAGLPPELRWRIMVLGCSVEDLNFWIRREDQDGGQWYKLTEIETGMEVGAVEAREACERYFQEVARP